MKLFREILYITFQFVYFIVISIPLCILLLIGLYIIDLIKKGRREPGPGQTIQK